MSWNVPFSTTNSPKKFLLVALKLKTLLPCLMNLLLALPCNDDMNRLRSSGVVCWPVTMRVLLPK